MCDLRLGKRHPPIRHLQILPKNRKEQSVQSWRDSTDSKKKSEAPETLQHREDIPSGVFRKNIREACLAVYPNAIFQLCQNHYKQSLRGALGLYQNKTHLAFMKQIETLFSKKISIGEFKSKASRIYNKHKTNDLACQIMLDIAKRSNQLMAYTKLKHIPRTNNLIESFNSHLEGRLKTIKGFESFKHAQIWLNEYFHKFRTSNIR